MKCVQFRQTLSAHTTHRAGVWCNGAVDCPPWLFDSMGACPLDHGCSIGWCDAAVWDWDTHSVTVHPLRSSTHLLYHCCLLLHGTFPELSPRVSSLTITLTHLLSTMVVCDRHDLVLLVICSCSDPLTWSLTEEIKKPSRVESTAFREG